MRTRSDIELQHRFGDDQLLLRLGGSYAHDDFDVTAPLSREDDNFFANATLTYTTPVGANMDFGYSYRKRDSDVAAGDFETNRVFVGLRIAF